MEQPKSRPQRFYGYPRPIEAHHIPFTKSEDANPVFSGFILMIGAWLYEHPPISDQNIALTLRSVSKLGFVQKFLWKNAGFDGLRKLKPLREYTERWDVSLNGFRIMIT